MSSLPPRGFPHSSHTYPPNSSRQVPPSPPLRGSETSQPSVYAIGMPMKSSEHPVPVHPSSELLDAMV